MAFSRFVLSFLPSFLFATLKARTPESPWPMAAISSTVAFLPKEKRSCSRSSGFFRRSSSKSTFSTLALAQRFRHGAWLRRKLSGLVSCLDSSSAASFPVTNSITMFLRCSFSTAPSGLALHAFLFCRSFIIFSRNCFTIFSFFLIVACFCSKYSHCFGFSLCTGTQIQRCSPSMEFPGFSVTHSSGASTSSASFDRKMSRASGKIVAPTVPDTVSSGSE
mmetsp:Transcript_49653/g.89245  ORF Transcript_49653/g.89245 Transcript_49653/m.89245 type:complete len:220 (-) Transcript_49653:65-724(-)